MKQPAILACNAGSNSLKCALFEVNTNTLLQRFEADNIHQKTVVTIEDSDKKILLHKKIKQTGYEAALVFFLEWQQENFKNVQIKAVGHRIVHGGDSFDSPVIVTPSVEEELMTLIPLAPIHQPHNLKLIKIITKHCPNVIQIACFDTAFHKTQCWAAKQYALPRDLVQREKIYRYGFHGLSYDYIAQILPQYIGLLAKQRIVITHLSGGCSACALKNGKSFATTMGFTALEGMMMGTRPGNVDPGVLLYLLQSKKVSLSELEELLYQKSGLLGVSGISKDMRKLSNNSQKNAKKAIELFCYRAACEIGSLMAALGGLDVLVFTGAMGKEEFLIREKICTQMRWLFMLDETANRCNEEQIYAKNSPVKVFALATDEEKVIAQQVQRLLDNKE